MEKIFLAYPIPGMTPSKIDHSASHLIETLNKKGCLFSLVFEGDLFAMSSILAKNLNLDYLSFEERFLDSLKYVEEVYSDLKKPLLQLTFVEDMKRIFNVANYLFMKDYSPEIFLLKDI